MRRKTARTATQSAPKTPKSAHCWVSGPVWCDDDDDSADKEGCDDTAVAQSVPTSSAMGRGARREKRKRRKQNHSVSPDKNTQRKDAKKTQAVSLREGNSEARRGNKGTLVLGNRDTRTHKFHPYKCIACFGIFSERAVVEFNKKHAT